MACSYAYATRSTVDSLNGRPMICIPSGNLSAVNPDGTDSAGSPIELKMRVKRVNAPSRASTSSTVPLVTVA